MMINSLNTDSSRGLAVLAFLGGGANYSFEGRGGEGLERRCKRMGLRAVYWTDGYGRAWRGVAWAGV